MTLPGMTDAAVAALEDEDGGSGPFSLADLVDMPPKRARDILAKALGDASGGGGGGGRRGRNGGGNKGQRADKMVKVLGQLPSVAVTLGRTDARIEADTELVLKVNIREKGNGKGRRGGRGGRAYTPHFPKPRPAGWWLILGDAEAGDLYALKRVKLNGRQTSTSLVFYAPEENGMVNMTLYLVSDTYLGLDQEVPFRFALVCFQKFASVCAHEYRRTPGRRRRCLLLIISLSSSFFFSLSLSLSLSLFVALRCMAARTFPPSLPLLITRPTMMAMTMATVTMATAATMTAAQKTCLEAAVGPRTTLRSSAIVHVEIFLLRKGGNQI